MNADTRPLHTRVRALANRFTAQANGYAKTAAQSLQDEVNARRDAQTLNDAADQLERLDRPLFGADPTGVIHSYRDELAQRIYESVYADEASFCPWGSAQWRNNADPRECTKNAYAAADAILSERGAVTRATVVR